MESESHIWHRAAEWLGHQGAVYDLALDAEGAVWSAGGDGLLVRWEREGKAWHAKGEARAKADQALFSVWAGREEVVAGGASGGLVRWSPSDTRILPGHDGGTYFLSDEFSAGADGRLRLWRTGEVLAEVEGRIRCALSLAGGSLLGTHDGRWHWTDGKEATEGPAHDGSLRAMLPWPGKPVVATVGGDGMLHLWREDAVGRAEQPWIRIEAHKGAVYRVAASPDGRWVATASRDKSIAIWSAESLDLVARLRGPVHKGHTRSVNALVWLDAETLVSGGDDRRILVWRIGQGPAAGTVPGRD